MNIPSYDITRSWDYNYDHGPNFKGPYPPPPKEAKWKFLGHKVISPLGVAAGPLPNAKWLITYAKLGYGSLVQKTVRTSAHKSHPFPNIVQVDVDGKLDLDVNKPLIGQPHINQPTSKLSITNSFGNPCRDSKIWMAETRKTRRAIKNGQLFGVSVYGTQTESMTVTQLANDYAKCAKLAKSSGAMFIEANLACPNVKGSENPDLYKSPHAVARIAQATKSAIGNMPLVLKIGYFDNLEDLTLVLKKALGYFEAVSAINTIPKRVVDQKGKEILPGRRLSGVCGYAIKPYGIKMVKKLTIVRRKLKAHFEIIGVGGVMSPQDVLDYLSAGANHVHCATAAMWNPLLAYDLENFKSPLRFRPGKSKPG